MVREDAGAMPMVDLNTTPLIDVMLVLLIIFMISAPLMAHRVPLPLGSSRPENPVSPQQHRIGIEALGIDARLTLDGSLISRGDLSAALKEAARLAPADQPEFRIDAEPEVRFEQVALLLAEGQRLGLGKMGLESRD
jgi:biopolymer transport protein ExbD